MGVMSRALDLLQRSRHQRSCNRSMPNRTQSLSDSIPTHSPTSPSAERCSANAYRDSLAGRIDYLAEENKHNCVRVSGAMAATRPLHSTAPC
jgi:hypothetical protein